MGADPPKITPPGLATIDVGAVAPADNLVWIMSSMKDVVPYLDCESVLCVHSVNKLLVWHLHNIHTWRILCWRDFPSARGQLHDQVILRKRRANDTVHTDHVAKALYHELFCQRFTMEAEVRLDQHYTGSILQQMVKLQSDGTALPVKFKASVGHEPASFSKPPPLAPNETSSLTTEWIPRSGVDLTAKNMDLLRRAFTYMAQMIASDPKDGPIQPGSGTRGERPRVVMSQGTTAEGDPVVVSSFHFQNGSEAWKRTRKGSRGPFQQVWIIIIVIIISIVN